MDTEFYLFDEMKKDIKLAFSKQITFVDREVDVSKMKGKPFLGDKKWKQGDFPLACKIQKEQDGEILIEMVSYLNIKIVEIS